jgi:hypothetical protein
MHNRIRGDVSMACWVYLISGFKWAAIIPDGVACRLRERIAAGHDEADMQGAYSVCCRLSEPPAKVPTGFAPSQSTVHSELGPGAGPVPSFRSEYCRPLSVFT